MVYFKLSLKMTPLIHPLICFSLIYCCMLDYVPALPLSAGLSCHFPRLVHISMYSSCVDLIQSICRVSSGASSTGYGPRRLG